MQHLKEEQQSDTSTGNVEKMNILVVGPKHKQDDTSGERKRTDQEEQREDKEPLPVQEPVPVSGHVRVVAFPHTPVETRRDASSYH